MVGRISILLVILLSVAKTYAESSTPLNSSTTPLSHLAVRLESGEGAEIFRIENGTHFLVHEIPPQEASVTLKIAIPVNLTDRNNSSAAKYHSIRYRGWLVEHADEAPLAKIAAALKASGMQADRVGEALRLKDRELKGKNRALANTLKRLNPRVKVQREFGRGFAGVWVEGISKKDLLALKRSRVISDFRPNFEVQASLHESLPSIKVPAAWSLGLKGEGINIGIIDTGVDYTHPDFGACLTPDFLSGNCLKVSGGYDFIDNDSDAMDCHGHGTHVASIAAGDGALKGVAPNANITPIRVLDCAGRGTAAFVIGGIEFSMDPDRDLNFADHLDVINLSLGAAHGDPDDPVSKAVDAAATAGVIAVIAAGNSGPERDQIGSPGTAREALTVGAVDRMAGLAYFSSGGPVLWKDQDGDTLSLQKPDVVAPGHPICAAAFGQVLLANPTCLDAKHALLSGTSMSTPHVAGLAALMRQKNPSWSVADIKSVIRHTSTSLAHDGLPLEQGHGLVDAEAALSYSAEPINVRLEPTVRRARYLTVKGAVSGPEILSFSLAYAPMRPLSQIEANEWVTLYEEQEPLLANEIEKEIDTYSIPDGDFVLRLSAVQSSGERFSDYGSYEVKNFWLTRPVTGELFRPLDDLKLEISHPSDLAVENFSLEYSSQLQPDVWKPVGAVLSPISSAALNALIPGGSIDNIAQSVTLRLRVTHYGGVSIFTTTVTADPDLRPGFPKRIELTRENDPWWGDYFHDPGLLNVLVGDVSGDEAAELVVYRGGVPPTLYIFSTSGELIQSIQVGLLGHYGLHLGYSPILDNFDSDSKKEIALYSRSENFEVILHVLNGDGTEVLGWPHKFSNGPTTRFNAALSAADVTGDGISEIIASLSFGTTAQVLSADATLLASVPLGSNSCQIDSAPQFFHWFPMSMPAVADIDLDCRPDIVSLTTQVTCVPDNEQEPVKIDKVLRIGALYGSKPIQKSIPGPFISTDISSHISPLLLDLNDDGRYEIIAQDDPSTTPDLPHPLRIFAFDAKGNSLPGWPIQSDNPRDIFWGSVFPIDLNQDSVPEIGIQQILYQAPLISDARTTFYAKEGLTPLRILSFANYEELFASPVYSPAISNFNPIRPKIGFLGSGVSNLNAFDKEGAIAPGFPKKTTSISTPTVADIDGDGLLEIIEARLAGGSNPSPAVFLEVWNTQNRYSQKFQMWPQYRHDNKNSGVLPIEGASGKRIAASAAASCNDGELSRLGRLQFKK